MELEVKLDEGHVALLEKLNKNLEEIKKRLDENKSPSDLATDLFKEIGKLITDNENVIRNKLGLSSKYKQTHGISSEGCNHFNDGSQSQSHPINHFQGNSHFMDRRCFCERNNINRMQCQRHCGLF